MQNQTSFLAMDTSCSAGSVVGAETNVLDQIKITAIFFDWDDTFLSYWHLSCLGVKMNASVGAIPECVGQELEDLELRVERAIEKALSLTPWVYIVSNSEDGWRFLCRIVPTLDRVRRIVSARAQYQHESKTNLVLWKKRAFEDLLKEVMSSAKCCHQNVLLNVLCFGDSWVEHKAIRLTAKQYPHVHVKTVLLASRPSITALYKQLEAIVDGMDGLCAHQGNLDLKMVPKNSVVPRCDVDEVKTVAEQQDAESQSHTSGSSDVAVGTCSSVDCGADACDAKFVEPMTDCSKICCD